MTWLLLIVCGFLVYAIHRWEEREKARVDAARAPLAPVVALRPRGASLVDYIGCRGETVLLESWRGVEFEIADDGPITLDEAIGYLEEVNAL